MFRSWFPTAASAPMGGKRTEAVEAAAVWADVGVPC